MAGFASRDETSKSPRFRVVADLPEVTQSDEGPPSPQGLEPSRGVTETISARLLIDVDAWLTRSIEHGRSLVTLRVDVPLIRSLAKIRSEADAARRTVDQHVLNPNG